MQHDADQERRDDHNAAAGQDDDVEVAAPVPDMGRHDEIKLEGPVGRQTRPLKFPDASSLKLKMIGSVLLQTAFVLMCLVMMRITSILMLKKTDPLMTTSSVMVGPMRMILAL